ncbi:MAG TPA: hypothetical protein VN223_05540 [Candidatus Elarobacter sp.]|nr:hypothetical protein [Candidatus Elarobacter sp.]
MYDYYPGHRSLDPKAAAIVHVSEERGHLALVVYKSGQQKKTFYYTPEYFETQNNGKSWQALIGGQPQRLPTVPYSYLQSPSNAQISYKMLPDLGLYLRSEDGGRTWIVPQYEIEGKASGQFAEEIGGGRGFHLEIRIVGVHPSEPKTLYAGALVAPWPDSADEFRARKLEGIYRSVDGGEHWRKFTEEIHAFGLNWTQTLAFGISPVNSEILFGVGRQGIEKSEDGGKTWLPVGQAHTLDSRPVYRAETFSKRKMLGAPVTQEVYEFLFDPQANQTLYMLTNRGVFKTTDLGKTWRLLDLGFDEIDAITTVGLNPIHTNQIVVGSRYGLYLSDDGGCHFQRIPSPGERRPEQERAGRY